LSAKRPVTVCEGEFEVKRVSTEFQLADIMTKPLHKPRLKVLCENRHFYVRERVCEGELEVKRVSAEFQLADMMTKPLHKPRL